MKKTIAAILLIAMVAVAIALPSFAAQTIYFTSVNNILMPLSDDTMPISYNGYIYVPYSVFNSTELGTFAVYSQSAQIVTVFGGGVQLYYNLQDGSTYDTYGNTYKHRAITTNGRIYIPVAFTCEYFSIEYSTIYGNQYGTIVRMTVGDVFDNATFSAAASALMKSRLDDYNRAKETPAPTVSPASTPAPTRTPSPPGPSTGDHSDINVFISFFGIDPEHTPRILTALQVRMTPSAFFVSAEEIAAYPELIRRISGSGHTLGIICGDNFEEDYKHASALLFDAAQTSSFITVQNSSAESAPPEDSGLICYANVADAKPLSLKSSLSVLKKADGRVDFLFIPDEQTADEISTFLRTMRTENYNVSRLTEKRAAEYSEMEN